jgi:hypothetical protein
VRSWAGAGAIRRALWILAAAVLVLVAVDFALDDTRMDDNIAFFVVVGVFLFGLGLLARLVAARASARTA